MQAIGEKEIPRGKISRIINAYEITSGHDGNDPIGETVMLVKFTIDEGAGGPPAERQARPALFSQYLGYLHQFDPTAEQRARESIRTYLDRNAAITAAWIACTNRVKDEWYPEFETLYECLIAQSFNDADAHAEAAKFLGLLVWNEMMAHEEKWHFTEYPKRDCDYAVTHYFSVEAYIRASAKDAQAANARAHGREAEALKLEADAKALRESKKKNP